jgi:hypothetical protein
VAGTNLSTFDAALKEFYGPGIVDDLYEEVPMLKLLEKGESVVISGRRFVVPVMLGLNQGVGARPENGVLPSAGNDVFQDVIFSSAYNYGTVSFTGQVIAQSRDDKRAFGRAAKLGMDNLKKSMRLDLNFQFLHNGKAARATINAGVTSASVTVDPTFSSQLPKGMVVDIYDTTLTTQKYTGLTVQAVTLDTSTWTVTGLTLSSAVTVVSGDVILRSGNKGFEINGLDGAVGAGVYATIDPATYEQWQSPVLGNGGVVRPITEDLFQRAVDTAENASGSNLKYWFTTKNVRRNFVNQLATTKRTVNTIKYEGGFDSIEFAGKEIFVDPMAIVNTMYGIDPEYVKIYETDGMGCIDDDGMILRASLDGSDSVTAKMRWYSQLGVTYRAACVKITDINEA